MHISSDAQMFFKVLTSKISFRLNRNMSMIPVHITYKTQPVLKHVELHVVHMLRPICEIAQFMNWAPLMPSS